MLVPEVKSETAIDIYETDFYAWTQEQADLLRTKQWINDDNLLLHGGLDKWFCPLW
jgi:hypothetical protein